MLKQKLIILWALAALVFLPLRAYAGAGGNFASTDGAYFDTGGDEWAYDVAVDTFSAGGPYVYVVGGSSMTGGEFYESIILKYDKDGILLASATYSNPYYNDLGDDGKDCFYAVKVDKSGNIFAGGSSQQSDSYMDYFIVKYNSNLVAITSTTFMDGSYPYENMLYGLVIDNAGDVIVTGSADQGLGNYDILTAKFDSNLVFISSTAFDYNQIDGGSENTKGCGIAVKSSNEIIITGESFDGESSFNKLTLRYSSDLSVLLGADYGDPILEDAGYGVAVDTSDNIYTAGWVDPGTYNDGYQLMKYNPGLTVVLSTNVFDISGQSDRARSVIVAKNGDVYATGVGNIGKWETVRYSSNLQKLAAKEYTAGYSMDTAFAVAEGTSTYIYVAGKTMDGVGTYNIRVLRYDRSSNDFYADITAPAQVTNLTAYSIPGMGAGMGGVKLVWSTPGDDGWAGALPAGSQYAIQYSTATNNFSISSPFTMAFSTDTLAPSTTDSYEMLWLMAGKFYYFKVWYKDDQGNWSPASNMASMFVEVTAGPPDSVTFQDPGITVQKDVASNPIYLTVRDYNWNITSATAPITVYFFGRLTSYIGNEYELDPSAVFYSTAGAEVTSLIINPGSDRIGFKYKTSASPYSVIQVTYTLGGFDRMETAWPTVINGGITNARAHKGDYAYMKALTIGSNDQAFIDFNLTDTYTGWQVYISTSPDRSSNIWTYWGWGMPYQGQVSWNGYIDYYDPELYTYRYEKAPAGTYYVRIQLGSGNGITDDSVTITLDSQEIFGRVTDTTGAPISGVYISAYGAMSSYSQSDSTGNYRLSGLVAGTYLVNFNKYGYSPQSVTMQPGAQSNVQLAALAYLKFNARRELSSDQNVMAPEQWVWASIHDSDYTKYYQGSMHFAVDVSTSDNDMYTLDENPKYLIENSTDNPSDGGRWTIVQVDPGTYDISASLDGYTSISTSVVAAAGQTKVIGDMYFQLKKTLYGNVTIPVASQDTIYVSVQAAPSGHSGSSGYGWCMIEPGLTMSTYTVYGLDAGAYVMTAWAPGYAKGTTAKTIASSVEFADPINLLEGGTLTGTITVVGDTTESGLGLTDPYQLYINAWSPDAYSYGWANTNVSKNASSASAGFSMKGLDNGTYWVNTWMYGFELEGAVGWNGVAATVSGGSGTLNLKLKRFSGVIQANITAPGNDYANVKVYLEGTNFWSSDWYMGVSPADASSYGGSFSNGVLTTPKLGTGGYRIKAVYTPTGMEKYKNVMVTNGETKSVNLNLDVNSYSISGTVSLSVSNPPQGINNFSMLVDTVNALTNSGYNTFWDGMQTTTTFRVFAVEYSKVGLRTTGDYYGKSGVINSNGSYTISGVVPGVYIIRIPALELDSNYENGSETAWVERRVIVTASSLTENLDVSKGYKVSGQVKLPAGTFLQRDMWMYIFKATKFKIDNYMGSNAWTNYVGSMKAVFNNANYAEYSYKGLAPGDYIVAVQDWGGGYQRQFANSSINIKVESSDLSGRNIQLGKGGKIILKLKDANSGMVITPQNKNSTLPNSYMVNAIANPWVEGGWGDSMGGSNQNAFEMSFLPEASYDVMLGQSSYGFYAPIMGGEGGGDNSGNQTNYAAKTITGIKIKNGQTVDLGTIEIKQGISITGTVRDKSGNPLANIPVIAVPAMMSEWTSELRGFTDINGKYSIVGLDPDTVYYDIVACPRINTSLFGEYFFFGSGGLNYGEKVKSMIKVTETKTVDFVLTKANGSVKGTITTEDGGLLQNPDDTNLPMAKVYLQPEDQMPRTNPIGDIVVDTELDGSFLIEALSPGYYRLFVLSGGYASYSKVLNIGESEVNAGTIKLKRGAKISGSLAKDGLVDGKPQYPSTSEIKSILAATDDLSEMLVGSLKLSGEKMVTGYEICGFQPLSSYNMMYLGEDEELMVAVKDNQSVIGFTVPYSTYTKTDFNLTFRPTAPAVFSRARKTAVSTFAIIFDLTGALRKSIPADDVLSSILTVTTGGGALSNLYMSPNRKSMSCTYTAPAGEKLFAIRLHGYSKTVNPKTGSEFEIDETLQYLAGIGAKNRVKVSNLRGGKITLDGDSSNVLFGPGAFDVNSSTVVVYVTFSRAESLEDLKSAPSKKGGPCFAIPKEAGAYPDRVYRAMKLAQAANVDPFSSFYDIMLPAGISHALKGNATLSIQYSSDVDPSTLNIYYYDENNNVYLLENTNKEIDEDTKVVSITVKHLSTFVLLQSDAPVIKGDSYDGPVFVYNFPNPFNLDTKSVNLVNASNQTANITGTQIHYGLPTTVSGEVEIKIYNVAGELVRTINDGVKTGGSHFYTEWNGKNDAGKKVASGVYVARFAVDKKNEKFFKMAVIK
ncbi:MAG: carboxypeptidase regulatory-like domain-containing protein [Elusimicrobiota bacterium]